MYHVFSPPLCRSPKQGAAPQRGDYATASGAAGRPRAASPSTAVTKTRSAAAASFARCIIVNSYYRQSGGAGSGGSPDKAGAYCKDQKERFGLVMVQVRRTPVVPLMLSDSILVIDRFCGGLESSFLICKMHSLLSIIYMSILRYIFLYRVSGESCRSGPDVLAVPERQYLPVSAGERLYS